MEEDKKKENLFPEFPPVPTSEWEARIKEDLKGADYNKKLAWDAGQGFTVKPYYRSEDLLGIDFLQTFPGDFPFVRGNRKDSNRWFVRQDIPVNDVKQANEKALDILMKGVDSLGFILDEEKEYSRDDLNLLLRNIFADIVEINFHCGKHVLSLMKNHYEMIRQHNRDLKKISGSVDFDPLGRLTTRGSYYNSKEEDLETCIQLIKASSNLPHFQVINVRGDQFHNSGCLVVEELAFSLAEGAQYLIELTGDEFSVNQVAPKIKFTIATGSGYFLEIAKIRAARLLWAQIVKAFGSGREEARMNIHVLTSTWNMSIYDPYVNILRAATESMASIIAGIDSMTIVPFDSVYGRSTDFSERIARNQQLLLKEESYFDKVIDPAAGSYYIDNLTHIIADEAWKLFLEVDSMGGYLVALEKGFIQDRIRETAGKRDINIATRKEVLLGVNQYPIFDEHIDEQLNPTIFEKIAREGTDAPFATLESYRGASSFEKLRYSTDQYSLTHKRPAAFMFTYGNLAMSIARSQFSRNFFACAGFEVIDNPGFGSIVEGIKASLESKAEIVVICSSDAEYAAIVPEIFRKLKDKCIVVVAGNPKDAIDKLRAEGIEHFIHARSNVLEALREFLIMLNILEL
jgi:methylmalonyl-CoA mutase